MRTTERNLFFFDVSEICIPSNKYRDRNRNYGQKYMQTNLIANIIHV